MRGGRGVQGQFGKSLHFDFFFFEGFPKTMTVTHGWLPSNKVPPTTCLSLVSLDGNKWFSLSALSLSCISCLSDHQFTAVHCSTVRVVQCSIMKVSAVQFIVVNFGSLQCNGPSWYISHSRWSYDLTPFQNIISYSSLLRRALAS